MATSKPRSPRPTAAEQLTSELRTRILTGALRPGQALREEKISAEYRLSRHTTRTALAALAAERLVTVEPYTGTKVVELTDADLIALQQLRAALESEAVRLLHEAHPEGIPETILAPIRTAVHELEHRCRNSYEDWIGIETAHAAVHSAVVTACGSTRIIESHTALDSELRLFMLHAKPIYNATDLAQQHHELIEQFRNEGAEAIRRHLAESTEKLLELRAQ